MKFLTVLAVVTMSLCFTANAAGGARPRGAEIPGKAYWQTFALQQGAGSAGGRQD